MDFSSYLIHYGDTGFDLLDWGEMGFDLLDLGEIGFNTSNMWN